jgi:hypothetical protein
MKNKNFISYLIFSGAVILIIGLPFNKSKPKENTKEINKIVFKTEIKTNSSQIDNKDKIKEEIEKSPIAIEKLTYYEKEYFPEVIEYKSLNEAIANSKGSKKAMEMKVFNKFTEKIGDYNERKQEEVLKIPVNRDGTIEYENISKEESTQ